MRLCVPCGLMIVLCLAACGGKDVVSSPPDRVTVRIAPPPAAEPRAPAPRLTTRPAPPMGEHAPPTVSAHRVRFAPPDEPAMDAAAGVSLTSADAADRERAVLEFEGDLAPLARLARDDASPAVRLAAVQRLAEGEGSSERAALRRALADRDPAIVAEAVLALETLDDPQAIPALERLSAHPDAEVRALALEALASLRD